MTERKEIDTARPCQTRDGQKAEFIRKLKGNPSHPLLWVVTCDNGMEAICTTKISGSQYVDGGAHSHDIINAPQTREVWLPVQVSPNGTLSIEREDIAYDIKPTDNYGGPEFVSWQRVTITDQPQGED